MKITSAVTDEAVLGELGRRLAQVRLGKNLTQAQLAGMADVAKRTVERLETGGAAPQLSGFVRICRALGLIGWFELLVPESAESPATPGEADGKTRRRASAPLNRDEGRRETGGGAGDDRAPAKRRSGADVRAVESEVRTPAAVPRRAADVVVVAHELN